MCCVIFPSPFLFSSWSQQLVQSLTRWLNRSDRTRRQAPQIQRSFCPPLLPFFFLSSGILCRYWDPATERNWNFNCQRLLMMPFSISAPLHQPPPPRPPPPPPRKKGCASWSLSGAALREENRNQIKWQVIHYEIKLGKKKKVALFPAVLFNITDIPGSPPPPYQYVGMELLR